MSDGGVDAVKLTKLDSLIQDVLDEIEDADEGHIAAEALYEPLSQASAALHAYLIRPRKLHGPLERDYCGEPLPVGQTRDRQADNG